MPLDDSDRAVLELLQDGPLSSSEVAQRLGVSRQAAHTRLARLVDGQHVAREGAARATRYRLPPPERWERTFPLAGLAEDAVYRVLVEEVESLGGLAGNAAEVLQYVVTELVNNSIDHSDGRTLRIASETSAGSTVAARVALEVEDDGIGAFARVKTGLGLPSELAAIQELSKGKTTTQPERHTGEGLFFVSKAVDVFRLASGDLAWVVDNRRPPDADSSTLDSGGDMAILELDVARTGTLASVEIELGRARSLVELFDRYTHEFEFSKTRTVVKLFEFGVRFVSRSEARRLLQGLDRFREVVLDFRGVEGVGQGFADEVFRVWARSHPEVELQPVNMNRAVGFLVRRSGYGRT